MESAVAVQRQADLPMTPAMMLEKAITSGANVEVMEKLMGLQERWEANQARKAFDAALSDLRENLPAIVKSKSANFGAGKAAYKYEDLSDMIDVVSPALSMEGLSFRWKTESTTPDAVTVTCILSHRDGHNESTSLTAKHDHSGAKNPIQAIGSVVTYLQRYTLKAALGVAASVDDDAQAASSQQRAAPPPQRAFQNGDNNQPPPGYSDAVPMVTGLVQRVDIKSGKDKNGKDWIRYGVVVDGTTYGTFDKAMAQFAQECEKNKQGVDLYWAENGKFKNIEQINRSGVDQREPGDD